MTNFLLKRLLLGIIFWIVLIVMMMTLFSFLKESESAQFDPRKMIEAVLKPTETIKLKPRQKKTFEFVCTPGSRYWHGTAKYGGYRQRLNCEMK